MTPYHFHEHTVLAQSDDKSSTFSSFVRTLCGHESGKGFTLIEVTISIFVIGMMIIASAALLRGVPLSRMTLNGGIALTIAQNEIESIRAGGYAAIPVTGSFADTALASLASGTGTVTASAYDARTKRVDVSVSWVEKDGVPHTVALTTLITQDGGLR